VTVEVTYLPLEFVIKGRDNCPASLHWCNCEKSWPAEKTSIVFRESTILSDLQPSQHHFIGVIVRKAGLLKRPA
jgi:hypothetical protein